MASSHLPTFTLSHLLLLSMAESDAISSAAPSTRAEPAPPKVELMLSLGRLVRGLSALFWGLPTALVVCVQTAKSEWLRPLGVIPPIATTALLFYGVMS